MNNSTFVKSQSLNRINGFIGHLAADAEVRQNGTIVNFRVITNERDDKGNAVGVGWPCTIFAKKGETVPQDILAILKTGALVTIDGSLECNPSESQVKDANGIPMYNQDGTPMMRKYTNDYIRVTSVSLYDPFNTRFSGIVVGEVKQYASEQDGSVVLSFRLSHPNGQKPDGSYYPSTFQDAVKFRATPEDIALVKTGAFITATGRLSASPRTNEDGKKYDNKRIIASRLNECALIEYTQDENGFIVGQRVLERQPRQEAAQAPAAQHAPAQGAAAPAQAPQAFTAPAPTAVPDYVEAQTEEDMPF